MKKGSFLGKRQIVLAVLILVLGVAVYLNWRYASDSNLDLTAALSSEKNMGDAQYVGAESEPSETGISGTGGYNFEQARTDRQQSRKDSLAMLTDLMNNTKSDEETKSKAGEDAAQLARNVEIENSVETLIKAKGFPDCIAIISGDAVNVIVQKEGELEQSEMLRIQDIVTGQTDCELDNIKIDCVK